ncbi:hypothetical protein R5R35_011187 [Gryllus longicercus]|uniref:Large ribosomal subunit protein bL28m n=1 Tax=Gryllus longicercus TaxID=2509291 RepID=A0AAN9Z5C5_9ORTH
MSKIPFNATYIKRFVPDAPFIRGRPGEVLPEAYKKFWREWKIQKPKPVHYIAEPGRWKRNPETGEVSKVQNVPIPLKFPKDSHQQLWGGEGVIQGYQKKGKYNHRVPHFWVPNLKSTIVYSEILNKYMTVVVADNTMKLIHENFGFDHYILKTPACDLQSDLALKLKRKLLTALNNKDLNHESQEKNEMVYEKYKQYLSKYTAEEIEWYGLTMEEALTKYNQEKEDRKTIEPLKLQYRLDLIQELLERGRETEPVPEEKKSWLLRINPFHSKKS